MKRLKLLTLAILATLVSAGVSSAQDAQIDVNSGEGAIQANRKIQCSLIDEKPITYYWYGRAYSRRMGEKDKHIFNVEGMNVRQCTTVEDDKRGVGYKLVSREILLYKDPTSNKILKTWDNPWTGETVDVLHVANDPVNFIDYEIGRDGKKKSFSGGFLEDGWQMTTTVPLYYPNPLASEYQTEIGGVYHATEMFNFIGDKDDLLDPNIDTAKVKVGWVRKSDWLPWMKMSGRDGIIYMHTAGRKMSSWDAMPKTMKKEIKKHYPEYVAPPPVSDTRKNVTSWEYYKSVHEGEVVAPKR